MRLIFWIIAIPVLALAGAFAAVNQTPVTLKLWPFPFELELPVSAAVLGAFIIGAGLTWAYAWFSTLGPRLARYRLERHDRKLAAENARLEEALAEAQRQAAQGGASNDDDRRRRALIAAGD
jgi:uncharacterized integral membrane protein